VERNECGLKEILPHPLSRGTQENKEEPVTVVDVLTKIRIGPFQNTSNELRQSNQLCRQGNAYSYTSTSHMS
jgi:hypothetical protein